MDKADMKLTDARAISRREGELGTRLAQAEGLLKRAMFYFVALDYHPLLQAEINEFLDNNATDSVTVDDPENDWYCVTCEETVANNDFNAHAARHVNAHDEHSFRMTRIPGGKTFAEPVPEVQPYVGFVDTATDIAWLPCSLCGKKYEPYKGHRCESGIDIKAANAWEKPFQDLKHECGMFYETAALITQEATDKVQELEKRFKAYEEGMKNLHVLQHEQMLEDQQEEIRDLEKKVDELISSHSTLNEEVRYIERDNEVFHNSETGFTKKIMDNVNQLAKTVGQETIGLSRKARIMDNEVDIATLKDCFAKLNDKVSQLAKTVGQLQDKNGTLSSGQVALMDDMERYNTLLNSHLANHPSVPTVTGWSCSCGKTSENAEGSYGSHDCSLVLSYNHKRDEPSPYIVSASQRK